jgi:hypothetical protein
MSVGATLVVASDVERYGNMQRDQPTLVPANKTLNSERDTHVTPFGGLSPPPAAGWTDSGAAPLSVLILVQTIPN